MQKQWVGLIRLKGHHSKGPKAGWYRSIQNPQLNQSAAYRKTEPGEVSGWKEVVDRILPILTQVPISPLDIQKEAWQSVLALHQCGSFCRTSGSG